MRLGDERVIVRVTPADIARGECSNRRQCVIAQALDRQFGLQGTGYVRVDANLWALTYDNNRYRYHPPRAMVRYLRKFDDLGKQMGLQAAREAMEPANFTCKLLAVHTIAPRATAARKKQINTARRRLVAEFKARGLRPEPVRPRYAGV